MDKQLFKITKKSTPLIHFVSRHISQRNAFLIRIVKEDLIVYY